MYIYLKFNYIYSSIIYSLSKVLNYGNYLLTLNDNFEELFRSIGLYALLIEPT